MKRGAEVAPREPEQVLYILLRQRAVSADSLARQLDELLLLARRIHQAGRVAGGDPQDEEH